MLKLNAIQLVPILYEDAQNIKRRPKAACRRLPQSTPSLREAVHLAILPQ
ncbi:hypothetical protein H6H03_06405 [Nostoc paludosum FACHB-159]|uniref:Uncharacterized protein n=1 Tax=Nostoc paludosum FACHB-159 TaxID=2692908 RepID=A0ABR8K5H5_9NOSO|nr:hypothetical protein [Nostoc paludosum FACHB-159]